MSDSRINLKNLWIAGALAFLIPGAGHVYQGRVFKGVLYFVCILGTFAYGLRLGEWKVVYYRGDPGNRTLGYFAQVGTGLAALPAIVQHWRYKRPENQPLQRLDARLDDVPFEGVFERRGATEEFARSFRLSGHISLWEEQTPFGPQVRGRFRGVMTTPDGEQMAADLDLGERFRLQERIASTNLRRLEIGVLELRNGHAVRLGEIYGGIPRPLWNRFQVPLEDLEQQRLHGSLGKIFELALLYTWIAGLLNILAVWDAVDGPAYGYGDEEPPPSDKDAAESPPSSPGSGAAPPADPAPGGSPPPRASEADSLSEKD